MEDQLGYLFLRNIIMRSIKVLTFLLEKKKVKIYNVDEMQGLGTPEDLNNFLRKLK